MKAASLNDPDTAVRQRQLWCAVILRAVEDATSPTPSVERSQARAWLTGYSHDFANVCDLAGRESDRIRAQAIRIIAEADASKPTTGRSIRRYTHDGLSLTIAEWADRTGIPHGALGKRLKDGWTIAAAVTTPCANRANSANRAQRYEHDGLSLTIAEWADRVLIAESAIRARLKLGWTIGRALTVPMRPNRNRKETHDQAHHI